MKPQTLIFRWIRIGKYLLFLFITVGLTSTSFAVQFDAPFYDLQEKNKDKWAAEDKQIDAKLAALEKKFGKKPNIIKIIADDIGYTELGVYGGGKLRGAPTPNLDKMAKQGIKFLQYYSEVSCTPTRIALMTGRIPVRTGVPDVLWPGEKQGLSPEEVTIAEALKEAGVDAAFNIFGEAGAGFAQHICGCLDGACNIIKED